MKLLLQLCFVIGGAVALLAAAGLPFDLVRGWLDAHAGDGAAEPYTPRLHRRLQIVASLAGLIWLGAGTTLWRWSSKHAERVRQWRLEISGQMGAFLKIVADGLWRHRRPLWTLIVVASLLRVWYLQQPLRFDEAYTYLEYAALPLPVTLAKYNDPNNHVLHSALIQLATTLAGTHEWAIRLPAFLAGILIVPTVYLIGLQIGSTTTGWIAALLAATSSPLIEYSVLARGYSLVALFTLLAIAVVLLAGRRPQLRLATGIALVVLSVAGHWVIPTFLYGFLVVLTLCWLVRRDTPWPATQSAMEIVALIALTALGSLLVYAPILVVSGAAPLISNPYVVSQTLSEQLSAFPGWLVEVVQFWTRDLPRAAVFLSFVGIVGLLRRGDGLRRARQLGAGMLLVLLAILLQRVTPYPRVMLFQLPLLCLLTARGWETLTQSLPRRCRIPTLVGMLAVVSWWPAGRMMTHHPLADSQEGGRCDEAIVVARQLAERMDPRDIVLVSSPCSSPLIYYGDRIGLARSHFAPIAADDPPPQRLFAVVSPHGETLPALVRSLNMQRFAAGQRWRLWHRVGAVEVWETCRDDTP